MSFAAQAAVILAVCLITFIILGPAGGLGVHNPEQKQTVEYVFPQGRREDHG